MYVIQLFLRLRDSDGIPFRAPCWTACGGNWTSRWSAFRVHL
ncbi:hypothetical protein [Longimicrobium terrae]|uniref:Uncharacterized protein n=1 Tax=Longimicrobium terrae TaxID=1639882 RepID=A0A841H559_9BACT|nr:hypothetical protein [Longimicrobium terrae]MBB4638869.1 hypothetical protein [Longimicrobium terrae]MBB6073108.1 hypothetical protein [Longimicrobium terrae]